MVTEVAYVCTEDFWPLLSLSMQSLFRSGTSFDRVVVYVVGETMPAWKFRDPRVSVRLVPDISDSGWGKDGLYWGTNKTHFCESDADRVIYLDVDTLVLKPIDRLYVGDDSDLLARHAVRVYTHGWDPDWWTEALSSVGVSGFPLYSPGFMVMQNSSHQRICQDWRGCIRRILDGDVPPLVADKHAELYAFSLACGVQGLACCDLNPSAHRYAMIGEGFDDAVVYHLGTPGFYRHYYNVRSALGIERISDSRVRAPAFLKLRALSHGARHRVKTALYGSRERRGEY